MAAHEPRRPRPLRHQRPPPLPRGGDEPSHHDRRHRRALGHRGARASRCRPPHRLGPRQLSRRLPHHHGCRSRLAGRRCRRPRRRRRLRPHLLGRGEFPHAGGIQPLPRPRQRLQRRARSREPGGKPPPRRGRGPLRRQVRGRRRPRARRHGLEQRTLHRRADPACRGRHRDRIHRRRRRGRGGALRRPPARPPGRGQARPPRRLRPVDRRGGRHARLGAVRRPRGQLRLRPARGAGARRRHRRRPAPHRRPDAARPGPPRRRGRCLFRPRHPFQCRPPRRPPRHQPRHCPAGAIQHRPHLRRGQPRHRPARNPLPRSRFPGHQRRRRLHPRRHHRGAQDPRRRLLHRHRGDLGLLRPLHRHAHPRRRDPHRPRRLGRRHLADGLFHQPHHPPRPRPRHRPRGRRRHRRDREHPAPKTGRHGAKGRRRPRRRAGLLRRHRHHPHPRRRLRPDLLPPQRRGPPLHRVRLRAGHHRHHLHLRGAHHVPDAGLPLRQPRPLRRALHRARAPADGALLCHDRPDDPRAPRHHRRRGRPRRRRRPLLRRAGRGTGPAGRPRHGFRLAPGAGWRGARLHRPAGRESGRDAAPVCG